MPDKEGSDDEKTTKGVVNKKQKQMMGEEGYDIARDMGRVKPSKDKKDATTMPVSDEVRKTQKVNTGPSALDRVLKKYGKSVMNVEKKSKKKANEELDLTKIAEAFGGHVVEANGKNEKKNNKKRDSIQDFIDADDVFDIKAKKQFEKDVAQEPDTDAKEDEFATGTQKPKPVVKKTQAKNYKPKAPGKNIKGEQGIKLNPFSGRINPKTGKVEEPPLKIIKKGSTAAKQSQRAPAPPKKSDAEKRNLDPKSTDYFEKDLEATGEPIGSPGMKSDIQKVKRYSGKKAERDVEGGGKKTGSLSKGDLKFSGDKSYRQLKKDMKGKELTAADLYQQRMQQAYDTGSGAPRFTNLPELPAGKGKPKGEPQKPRPKDEPAIQSGIYSGRGVGRQEKIPTSKTQETGRRASQSKDPALERAAQTGINPRTGEYYPDIEAGRKLRKLDFQTGRGRAVNTEKSKGDKSFNKFRDDSKIYQDPQFKDEQGRQRDRFKQDAPGREGESITMKSRASQFKTDYTDPMKVGQKFQDLADKSQKAQQSMMGAMGGMIAKTAFPASAGAEAGLRFARGDKMGATLSALQSMGGGLGFGAGVLNALRSMSPKYTPAPRIPTPKSKPAKITTATPPDKSGATAIQRIPKVRQPKVMEPPGGKEAMMSAGGVMLSKILQNVRNSARDGGAIISPVRGGRAGRRSAKQ